jgi:hypothetical protein
MANRALEKLEAEDFNNTDVSVLLSSSNGTEETEISSGSQVPKTSAGVPGILLHQNLTAFAARRYGGRVTRGEVLLSVHTASIAWGEKAKEILIVTGAEDISKRSISPQM